MGRRTIAAALVALAVGWAQPAAAQFRLEVWANNAATTLATGIDDNDTALDVADGSAFPSPTGGQFMRIALAQGGTVEIVSCTARSGNTISGCTRGSSPQSFTSGADVYIPPAVTATMESIQDALAAAFVTTSSSSHLANEVTTLPVANGGTGLTSGTSGGVPYFSGSTSIASSAALAANALVIGGGAGVAPATTTTGSGVLTALGNAVNGSGGFVTADGTATLTNKPYNVESTGNDFTATTLLAWYAGVTQAGNPMGACSTPASNAPAVTAQVGTNTIYATYDFDASTDESIQCALGILPTGFTGTVDIELMWSAAATSGAVSWCVATGSVADGQTGDPALDDVTCGDDTAKGTTNQFNALTITGIDVDDWAAGEFAFLRLFRNADASNESPQTETDSMTGDARLIAFTVTMRRTM